MDREEDSEGETTGLLGPGVFMYFFCCYEGYDAVKGNIQNRQIAFEFKIRPNV